MFRFLFAAFALMFMASLFFGPEGAATGVGLAVLAPFLFFAKFLFFMMLFGFFFRTMAGGARPWSSRRWDASAFGDGASWQRWSEPAGGGGGRANRRSRDEAGAEKTRQERFQEMHDLAHAREEVDSWGTYDL
jgi:hypothetical protein